jgi:hypothetical protein
MADARSAAGGSGAKPLGDGRRANHWRTMRFITDLVCNPWWRNAMRWANELCSTVRQRAKTVSADRQREVTVANA